jgi:DNA-binding MarR family transcriptional regulator
MSATVTGEQILARGLLDMSGEEQWSWKCFADSASLLYREINSALTAEHNLAIRDVQILQQLSADPSRLVRMGALAGTLGVSPSLVTWLVTRLENRGLVGRVRSRKDRRIVVVGITRKGEDRLRLALGTYAELVRQYYLDSLTRDRMIALGDSASRLNDGSDTGPTAAFRHSS